MEGFTHKFEKVLKNPHAAPQEPEQPEAPQPPQLTLPEIMESKDKEFGALIASQNKKSLDSVWARYLAQESTAADMKVLMEQVTLFNQKTREGELLVATLDDYAEDVLSRSPEYKALVTAHGAEPIKEVLKKGLMELVYKNPQGFAAVGSHFDMLEHLDGVEHSLNESIATFCAEHRISEDELAVSMQHADFNERQKAIKLLLRHKLTTWERFKDDFKNHVTQGGTRSHSLGMASRRGEFTKLSQVKEHFLKEAGSSLAALLTKNDEIRKALLSVRSGETPELKEGIQSHMSFNEAREMKPDYAEAEEYFADFKASRGITDESWARMSDEQHNRTYETAYKNYTREVLAKRGQGGLWAALARFLFGQKMNDPKMKSLFTTAKKHEA